MMAMVVVVVMMMATVMVMIASMHNSVQVILDLPASECDYDTF